MSESICRFMSAKNEDSTIQAVRFVYETECHSLTQPFLHPIYVFHIVTKGTAVFRIGNSKYSLKRGDAFFAFPAFPYYLDADDEFEYIYISFMGNGATSLLPKCNITPENPYYADFGFLCTMFENAIRRITPSNSNLLAEAVLYYALSFFDSGEGEYENDEQKNSSNIFQNIVDYVDYHYRESDISLGRLANVFSYTEKYLSSLFKKNMQIGFISYLNNLRIQYACELIQNGNMNMSEIAVACGYSDYSYFSKVFKKITGHSPTDGLKYLKNQ
ncbi:MAG: AraC family transcriptional regulator [Ruminococcaceae bacterium]|nr:AraC family transcriptional regulator [Oscillospiraceae bacterium]